MYKIKPSNQHDGIKYEYTRAIYLYKFLTKTSLEKIRQFSRTLIFVSIM